ncbi:MAG TPA: metallopeptidase TldD-related protein, partial [Candidatus Marinimicrobia bacterium]|nr:metallopeptidase TldD-related protein [Candidatus Neomarinimicrobiota bacterium]
MKRREFIKKSGVIAAGIVTAPAWFDMEGFSKTVSETQDLENLFNISAVEAEKLLRLALSRGAQSADLFFEYRPNSSLRIEDGIIKDIQYGISLGMGVRAVKGDQIGYAYTDAIDFQSMKRAAETAANIANSTGSFKPARFQKVAAKNLYPVKTYRIDMDLNPKITMLNEADTTARQFNARVSSVIASFSEELRQIMYFDSDGKKFQDIQPLMSLRVQVIAEDGVRRQGASASRSARAGLEFFEKPENSPSAVARQAAATAIINLDAKPAPTGPQVVILGAGESGVLIHEAVGHGLEADYSYKNLSNYSGKVGQKVAAENCTIIDSGLFPGKRGALNVDDEGNLPTTTVLIENGILKGYMHNSISARMMKSNPTGNGRRQSYAYPPLARMTTTYLQKGNYEPEEIISSVKKGVYAKGFSGGQVDTIKGDFTFGVT